MTYSSHRLHKTKIGCDVNVTFTHKGGDYERSAHAAIICPRSSYFMDALNLDIEVSCHGSIPHCVVI